MAATPARWPRPLESGLRYHRRVKRFFTVLGAVGAAVGAGVVAYVLVLMVDPPKPVCHGGPGLIYCDTHAGRWALVALAVGTAVGGLCAVGVLRYRGTRRFHHGTPLAHK
jgi:hypothetical protein